MIDGKCFKAAYCRDSFSRMVIPDFFRGCLKKTSPSYFLFQPLVVSIMLLWVEH